MRDVAIVGVGLMKWGELWEKSIRDLCVEAALSCFEDAGNDKIDSIVVGTMASGLLTGQEHMANMVPDYLGKKHVPAMRVESACCSGSQAVRTAFMEVASGMSDCVLALGVEKMTDVSGNDATYALATASDQEFEAFHGVTFPGLYAMMARKHMEQYGTTREQLAEVSSKNHRNGSLNPHAQYPFPMTREQVMNSTLVADPLRLMDCSPITDGAAAVLLVPATDAKKYKKHGMVVISGVGHATDTIALCQRKDMLKMEAVTLAAKAALKMAGKTIKDVNFAEVHDCFTIAEIMIMEALGIVKPGQGGPATLKGLTALEGKFPVNPSGGLKSKGHPVGATGVAQICEAVYQLRGEAGKRQVKNAKVGLTQNMGGTGGTSVVHILEAK
ncbi:MAG: thiolase domain-containing protein [Candidatus Riflebacteria bacterium]|nr:thiolase domain-containing protein [Candidatus Riflebacteria bacterium]